MGERRSFARAGASAREGTPTTTAPPGSGERRAKPLSPLLRPPSTEELEAELAELRARYRALAVAERELRSQLDELGRMSVRLETERTNAQPRGARDLTRTAHEYEALLARERAEREELERINRVKDRFIAVLSHDLRAPLNAILGWAQLLQREQLGPDERERAYATIERNARTQANLIEELLDVSRISADRIRLALGPMDAGAATQRAVEAALPKARELGLTIAYEAEPELTVIADRQRLEQILSNLLSNAMKYTSAPGRIMVRAARVGACVEIVVRDTGRGIAPELLPVIFEMYTQEWTYTASRHGLGLGLFIVKQLVELQQGTVRVESAGVGQGATFIVSFPAEDGAPAAAPSVHALDVPTQLRDVRVLVVDDDEDSRELMVSILARAGAKVGAASNVEAALELYASFRPEVVVSDLAMPRTDGWELIAKVRELDPAIGALAVSGFTSQRDTESAIAAGFDMHIGKPLDAVELVESVYEVARARS